MKKIILAVAFLFGLSTSVLAQEVKDHGIYSGIGAGYNFVTKDRVDNTSDVNVFLGYYYGPYRWEMGYDRFDSGNLDGNLYSTSLLYDISLSFTRFRPFIGFGVGYLDLSDSKEGKDGNGIVWMPTAGLAYPVTKDIEWSTKYRYMNSEAQVKNTTGGNTDYTSHNVTTGIVLKF